MPPTPDRSGWLALIGCSVLWASVATSGTAQPPARVAQAEQALRHGDPPEAKRALAQLSTMRGMPAAPRALRDALRAGLPDALVVPSLEALAELGGPEAAPTLAEFSGHRRVAVRLAAYRGLIALAEDTAPAFLATGLRDSDPRVRDLCARGLGELGASDRVDVLLLALTRGVYAAAPAIGQVGDGPAALRYTELLERMPLPVMLRGYRAFLERSDFASQDKLTIVARLTEVASPEVKRFLQMVLVSVRWRNEPDVKRAIELAIGRIVDQSATPGQPAEAPQ